MAQTTQQKLDILESGCIFDSQSETDPNILDEDPETAEERIRAQYAYEAEVKRAAKRRLVEDAATPPVWFRL